MILLPVACYWIYSTILFILSWLRLTSVELHRIPTDQKMRPANRVTVSHVLQRVAVQHAIQIAVAYGLAVGMREDNMSTRPVEHPLLFVAKIVIASVMLDTYQYWMHRWMHTNRWLYRNFHSVHHELTVLYAFGALYNHPLEGLLMDTVGSGLPTLVLDMHPWTATAFFCIATLKTVDDHCGYALPWDPLQTLFRNNAVYHDIHHWGKGRMYNFSQPFFTFWDVWMGTDYEIAMQKQAAAKAQRSVANGDFSSAAVAAEPPMTTVTTTRRALSEPPDGGVARRRVVSKTLQVADDINPVTPPSPTLSCSDCSNDSAIGSSCGDWEAERAAEKACDDRNAPDIIESDPWRLPAATRT
ncbi:fatty acid hydroxylase superfamily-domain-containing protein [Geranomyces variabilis]|nr:fatty acid hydroxylase superfamily-domain-containing protein [Geranomyces variabilis]KAJ3132487.1 hypothetical protein HDU90_006848 [Geranomyces variabilis]